MPSAVDIPRELLSAERRDAFINWCRRLPVTPSVRRRLARTFTDVTGARLSAADYHRATTEPSKED